MRKIEVRGVNHFFENRAKIKAQKTFFRQECDEE